MSIETEKSNMAWIDYKKSFRQQTQRMDSKSSKQFEDILIYNNIPKI